MRSARPRCRARQQAIGEKLPRDHRLRKRSEFERLQQSGRRYVSGALVLLVQPNDLGWPRLGVTVSSKVGNSVVRSKVKRRLRDLFRKGRALLPASIDVVFVARPSAAQAPLERLRKDFETAAAQARSSMGPGRRGS